MSLQQRPHCLLNVSYTGPSLTGLSEVRMLCSLRRQQGACIIGIYRGYGYVSVMIKCHPLRQLACRNFWDHAVRSQPKTYLRSLSTALVQCRDMLGHHASFTAGQVAERMILQCVRVCHCECCDPLLCMLHLTSRKSLYPNLLQRAGCWQAVRSVPAQTSLASSCPWRQFTTPDRAG